MAARSQESKTRGSVRPGPSLNVAIDDFAEEASSAPPPAKPVFVSVSALLTVIRDSMANEEDYVNLGLHCVDICRALDRGLGGKRLDDLNKPVREAINQLMTTVADIQQNVPKQSGRNSVSRLLHKRNNKGKIVAWKAKLDGILLVFNTELAINTHVDVAEIRDAVSRIWEFGDQVRSVQTSTLGESPPPPLKACFGRDELIESIIGLAEKLNPIALLGAGGIGKTSIALTVLHHHRIENRFGENRRFIRCDQFPPSRANFLRRVSEATGAGVKNPEDLTPLRQFLSSKEMIIILDNAESILDPQGLEAPEIYGVVKELTQFTKVCLVLTSRITTVPPDCERLDIPTLSADAARSTFYRIHGNNEQPDLIATIIEQLDFHPLSVTLLATVAYQNNWNNTRLAKEWKERRTTVLQTEHKESLADAIELSLASPTFQELGPAARELLGVVAFFPQGVHEDNLNWLFPTIPNPATIFDKFCTLSLTYRSNGFITMLVPLRDYFRPNNPLSSPPLRMAKESYFKRLKVELGPNLPGFEEARWIVSEDTNVEHLINVLIPIDNSDGVWKACDAFLRHLYWHKLRRTVLGPKIEELPDDHRFKCDCLLQLGRVLGSIGNPAEQKRLLGHVLKLERERKSGPGIARTLEYLSGANLKLGLYEEGILQAKEALEIYEQIGTVGSQAELLLYLAWLLEGDNQLDAAKKAASRVIDLLPDMGEEFSVCRAHRALGDIYCSKGEREEAIRQYETALGITSHFNWNGEPFRIHLALADLFRKEGRFEDAHSHIEKAKQHTAKGTYYMGHAALEQAHIFYQQRKLESAANEARCALDIFEEFSSPRGMKHCRDLLQDIEQAKSTSGELCSNTDAHIGQCKYT